MTFLTKLEKVTISDMDEAATSKVGLDEITITTCDLNEV